MKALISYKAINMLLQYQYEL